MALTAAERQRRYREKHLKSEDGQLAKLSVPVSIHATASLRRLAGATGASQRRILETLLAAADAAVYRALDPALYNRYADNALDGPCVSLESLTPARDARLVEELSAERDRLSDELASLRAILAVMPHNDSVTLDNDNGRDSVMSDNAPLAMAASPPDRAALVARLRVTERALRKRDGEVLRLDTEVRALTDMLADARARLREPAATAAVTPPEPTAGETGADPAPLALAASKPDRAALAGRVRALAGEGVNPSDSARQMEAEGYPTPSGRGRWHREMVKRLLAE